jgi:hypothetical protein
VQKWTDATAFSKQVGEDDAAATHAARLERWEVESRLAGQALNEARLIEADLLKKMFEE